jgi:pimeloyl-ACP methyl ester carboxylesterase
MVQNGQEPFAEYISKNMPLGLIGHSMGGGLCLHVASNFPSIIDYVFCMAPAPAWLQHLTAGNYMRLAGKWDLIARDETMKKVSALCNSEQLRSFIYVDIDRGLYTGFQDDLVMSNLDLSALARLDCSKASLCRHFLLPDKEDWSA